MKSYWIIATIVLLSVWLSSSKAYVGMNQSRAEGSSQQTESSNPSAVPQTSVTTQGTSTAAKPAVTKESSAKPSAVAPASQPNSYILVELNKSLKAKTLKPGDKVKAKVSQDVISHGKVIIPVETELVGHVTEVQLKDGENSESRLGIVFDTILLKHFHDINCQAVVQAVAAPAERRSLVDQPSQMVPPSMSGGGGGGSGSLNGGSRGALAGRTPLVPPSAPPSASDPASFQVPLTVKDSQTANTSTGSTTMPLGSGGKPMSVGTPQGVTGIKGLSLSLTPSAETPGPVIISKTDNVKLESGTQILLHVMSIEVQK
jgi:hypothetical protein